MKMVGVTGHVPVKAAFSVSEDVTLIAGGGAIRMVDNVIGASDRERGGARDPRGMTGVQRRW